MNNLNQLIKAYTYHLQQGEIQIAYKGILEFIGKLRADFIKKYPLYEIGGIYQGYMDMTYFPISTKPLKDSGLKLAVVYLHDKGAFEVWLSARNRKIAETFKSKLSPIISEKNNIFHDENNQDAIIEATLTSAPDFEKQAALVLVIEQSVQTFAAAITDFLSPNA